MFCFRGEEELFSLAEGNSFEDSFWGSFKALFGFFWGSFRLFVDICGVVFGDSFAYLFVTLETWFPAPKAPGRKVVYKREAEICSVKKMRRTGECWPVRPGGSAVAGGRLRLPV